MLGLTHLNAPKVQTARSTMPDEPRPKPPLAQTPDLASFMARFGDDRKCAAYLNPAYFATARRRRSPLKDATLIETRWRNRALRRGAIVNRGIRKQPPGRCAGAGGKR